MMLTQVRGVVCVEPAARLREGRRLVDDDLALVTARAGLVDARVGVRGMGCGVRRWRRVEHWEHVDEGVDKARGPAGGRSGVARDWRRERGMCSIGKQRK